MALGGRQPVRWSLEKDPSNLQPEADFSSQSSAAPVLNIQGYPFLQSGNSDLSIGNHHFGTSDRQLGTMFQGDHGPSALENYDPHGRIIYSQLIDRCPSPSALGPARANSTSFHPETTYEDAYPTDNVVTTCVNDRRSQANSGPANPSSALMDILSAADCRPSTFDPQGYNYYPDTPALPATQPSNPTQSPGTVPAQSSNVNPNLPQTVPTTAAPAIAKASSTLICVYPGCKRKEKPFFQPSNLKTHMNSVYNRSGKWTCHYPGCRFQGQSFSRKASYVRHFKSKHGIKICNEGPHSFPPNASDGSAQHQPAYHSLHTYHVEVKSPADTQMVTNASGNMEQHLDEADLPDDPVILKREIKRLRAMLAIARQG
ncbi:hypothetical protein GE09DRAFT_1294195 [Coniochaeta sp. 2T2.1]|nr:hypothetical protein GE09DRAFT_1294195 [Coniochaeta sp. 2T2.1]